MKVLLRRTQDCEDCVRDDDIVLATDIEAALDAGLSRFPWHSTQAPPATERLPSCFTFGFLKAHSLTSRQLLLLLNEDIAPTLNIPKTAQYGFLQYGTLAGTRRPEGTRLEEDHLPLLQRVVGAVALVYTARVANYWTAPTCSIPKKTPPTTPSCSPAAPANSAKKPRLRASTATRSKRPSPRRPATFRM